MQHKGTKKMKNEEFFSVRREKIGVVRLKTTTRELKGVNTQEKRLRTQLLSYSVLILETKLGLLLYYYIIVS